MKDEIKHVPLANLRPPRVLLRPVHKRSVAYLEMRRTIRDGNGPMNSICVRPTDEPDVYEIIDGLYRFTCCEELRHETIPCVIKTGMTDEQVLALQIQANAIRPETTPVEFARQLKRIQAALPEITASEMCGMVGKSVKWIKQQLSLLDLCEKVQQAVDRDEMPLLNAYMLAKIPQSMQPDFLQAAKDTPPGPFKAMAVGVIRQVMEAMKQGKLERWFVKEFKPQPFLKSLKVILKELEAGQVGTKTVLKAGCKTPLEGWRKALEWAASLDAESVEKQQRLATKRQQRSTLERTKEDVAPLNPDFDDPDSLS